MLQFHQDISYERRRVHLVIAALLFLFIMALIPGLPGQGFDTSCWKIWASYICNHGLRNAYGSGTDYPPLDQYFLWLFSKVAGTEEYVGRYIGYLRVFTLAADYWGLWLV